MSHFESILAMAVLHMGVLHNIMAYGGQETTAAEKSCHRVIWGAEKRKKREAGSLIHSSRAHMP